MTRRAVSIALTAALIAAPASALAAWQTPGSGDGYSAASALAAGNPPTGDVTGRNVTVSWAAPGGAVPATGYVVRRYDASGGEQSVGAGCAGVVTALSCTEVGVAPGSWRYSVTPVRAEWRGAESARSAPVTVAPPALTLSPATVTALPAALIGQVSSYRAGQTVTFRLDDPATGQLLTGSITPTPVPSAGTASVSVTLPTGIAPGDHTVYAVGSEGDVASAPVAVHTCTPTTLTVSANQDSYVDSLLAGQNFGSATALNVGPPYLLLLAAQRAFVRFNLPAPPPHCTLTAATLRLYATAPGAGRTIQALRLASTWTETGVTWANQPAATGAAVASASLSSPGWQQWNVLAHVQAMYAGANNGFLIRDSADTGVLPPHQAYQSREGTPNAQDPQLVLTFG